MRIVSSPTIVSFAKDGDVGEETQLIDQALQGDRAAFAQLVELNQDRLFASMLQVTGSPDEAEEVVQEAFIRVFVKLDTFQRNSQFFTWLYRIAFNSALTRRRRSAPACHSTIAVNKMAWKYPMTPTRLTNRCSAASG